MKKTALIQAVKNVPCKSVREQKDYKKEA